jgi:Ca-activated chloride channel family protein
MALRTRAVLQVICYAILATAGEGGQTGLPQFRVDTTLVHLDVQVELNNGDIVRALKRDDFVVYDEGLPQRIVYFETEAAPVDLIFLLDVSESMNWLVDRLLDTQLEAIRALTVTDRVALMAFDTRGKLLVPFTTDHTAIVGPIKTLAQHSFTGGTDLYRGLRDACEYIQRAAQTQPETEEARNRRVILMLTDGIGGANTRERQTLRELWEADAILDVMIVDPTLGLLHWDPAYRPQDLRFVAPQTGGAVVVSKSPDVTLQYMLERCRLRYSIYYQQPSAQAKTFHRTRVELAPELQHRYPQARIRVRSGYYVK